MLNTSIYVPTLSTLGFVSDPVTKFEFLISHFFLSDYNQTYLYVNNVTSLPRIIEKNGENMSGVIYDLKNSLDRYLARYYDGAESRVDYTDPNSKDSNVSLNISVTVTDKGTQNTFTRLLETTNGKVQSLVKINNYG